MRTSARMGGTLDRVNTDEVLIVDDAPDNLFVLHAALMPGIDGFEVARRLKAPPRTAHIPIVFMTGLSETEHLVFALEAGSVYYVTKPIKPEEVPARVSVHLKGARKSRQPRNALDAFGYANITVRVSDCKPM